MPDSLWPELINPILAAALLGARNQTSRRPPQPIGDVGRTAMITKVADHPG